MNFISSPILVTSGIPRGHLSPLVFNLFINDAGFSITYYNILLFADDAITSIEDCKMLQKDLNSFNEWCTSNDLSLNTNKCQVITFVKKH